MLWWTASHFQFLLQQMPYANEDLSKSVVERGLKVKVSKAQSARDLVLVSLTLFEIRRGEEGLHVLAKFIEGSWEFHVKRCAIVMKVFGALKTIQQDAEDNKHEISAWLREKLNSTMQGWCALIIGLHQHKSPTHKTIALSLRDGLSNIAFWKGDMRYSKNLPVFDNCQRYLEELQVLLEKSWRQLADGRRMWKLIYNFHTINSNGWPAVEGPCRYWKCNIKRRSIPTLCVTSPKATCLLCSHRTYYQTAGC